MFKNELLIKYTGFVYRIYKNYGTPGQTKLRLLKRLFKRLRCEFIRLFSHLKRLILILSIYYLDFHI
jgi:hypothetical protein